MLYSPPTFLPFPLTSVPEGGMLYYLESYAQLRGRNHMNSFFMAFKGGEKPLFQFWLDQQTLLWNYILLLQSWDVQYSHYMFVRLFPPPFIFQPVPMTFTGARLEPATESKNLAYVSMYTEESGPKSRSRKLLFGLPQSWVGDGVLTPTGLEHVDATFNSLTQTFHPENEDSQYSWGHFHRYVDHVKRSPLIPTNFWPHIRYLARHRLIKHRPPALSSRTWTP